MRNKLLKICGLVVSAIFYCQPADAQTTYHDVGGYKSSTALFNGSVDQKAPFCFAYNYSCVQQIYTAQELAAMKGKKIKALKFRIQPNDWQTDEYTNTTKIYFVETAISEYARNEYEKFLWIPVTEANLVCTQPVKLNLQEATINSEELEIEYTLAEPYLYRGKNLMIMVVQRGVGTECADNDFYCFPATVSGKPVRTLYNCDHYKDLNAPFPDKSDNGLRQVPVVIFTCIENDTPEPDPDLALVPIFYRLEKEYQAGGAAIPLEIRGKGKELFTVFKVNGQSTREFIPSTAGKYKVEALSTDGKACITAWITVR